jgi:GT2 family glycosyltransferase
MKPSVVIAAFHRPGSLQRLLHGLTDPALEVVVVNIEGDAAVSAVVRSHDAREILTEGNVGFAAAVNTGAQAASGPVVVFMNDDVVADADAVLALAAALHNGVDVAVPRVVDQQGDHERTIAALPSVGALAREWMLLPDRPIASVARRWRVEKWREPARPSTIDAAAATVVAVDAALLRATPLPEDYFLYWEECEWFWNLRARGAVVEYRPDVVVMHDGGRADVRPEKSRLLARNAVRCVRRTQGRAAALVAVPIVIMWNVRLLAVAIARRRNVGARWAGLRAACGSWELVR